MISVPVNEAVVTDDARRYVAEAMAAGWLSSAGPAVREFEHRFAEFVGARHAVTTTSGTTALHLALATLGVGPGDEVIVPDFTMIAPVAAVMYTGATPVFVDIDSDTFTIDVEKLDAVITMRTKALLPVHIYGHSAEMDPILAVARARGLWVVEDAAEAHGATYRGRMCGSMGDLGCFSFYGNKIITTGEGGMLVTDNIALADRARHLRDLAHVKGLRFTHDDLGFCYRMSNLQAACGLGQLQHVEAFLDKKRWMAAEYAKRLSGITGLRLPITKPWVGNVYWMYTLLVAPEFGLSRDEVCEALRQRGVETRSFFQSAARQTLVRQRVGEQPRFPVSEDVAARGLYLPSGLALTERQIDHVCDAVADIAQHGH